MMNRGAEKPTLYDASGFIRSVKNLFINEREKYDEFLDILIEFRAKRVGPLGVKAKVMELLEGHKDLLLEFNMFLPKGYQITSFSDEPVISHDVMGYINNIRIRLGGDNNPVYESLVDKMAWYGKNNKTPAEVAALFGDNTDLLDEFTNFVPNTTTIEQAASVEKGERTADHDANVEKKQRFIVGRIQK